MELLTVLSLFDGIAYARLALQQANIQVKAYYASEIATDAISIALKNFPLITELGSVTCIKVPNAIDLLVGGSPCQDLSRLKHYGAGLEGDKSNLLKEYIRIKKLTNPRYFLLENVVPRKQEWLDDINNLMGIKGVLINSDRFVCQNRPRYYWTNIPIKELPPRPMWNNQYYQWRRVYFRSNKSGVCPCLTANMGTGGNNVPLHSLNIKDKLTPEECEELQGLPRGYTAGVANSRRYRVIGDGMTVPVITHIFGGITYGK